MSKGNKYTQFIWPLLLSCIFISSLSAQIGDYPNIIFIVTDDMNDYISPLTNDMPQVSTPRIQQLADSGTLFINAFGTGAGCAPSRTAMLSGKDIAYTRVYNNNDYLGVFRDNFNSLKGNETVFTLPEVFRENGYFTYSINKVFHDPTDGDYDDSATPECDKELSWNRWSNYSLYDSAGIPDVLFMPYAFTDSFYIGEIPDSYQYLMTDEVGADRAVDFIRDTGNGTEGHCGQPFFLAVGLKYPHYPHYIPSSFMPEWYMDNIWETPYHFPFNEPANTFPCNGVVMPPQPDTIFSDYDHLPEDGIARLYADFGQLYEITEYYDDSLAALPLIDFAIDDSARRDIIEQSLRADYLIAYLAAIEFADYQLGKIIDALYDYPSLSNNTIIVFVSDNGYTLGEKRHWEKWSLWETDLRIPFIIVDPHGSKGQHIQKTVSQIDLFPTLCSMAGIPLPAMNDGSTYTDGTDLLPLLSNPTLNYYLPALSSVKKYTWRGSCYPAYSLRDERFHYIIYRKNNDGTGAVNDCDDSQKLLEEELYEIGENREVDPHEWNNLIDDEDYQPLINYLHQWLPDSVMYLQAGYRATIVSDITDCLSEEEDIVHLSFTLYNPDGNATIVPPGFTCEWSNNLTDDIIEGNEIDFDLSEIDDATFESNYRIIIYLKVYDNAHHLAAFDMRYIYLANGNSPDASFSIEGEGSQTATVVDFTITGTFQSYWWDFGTGPMFYNQVPGPYTFPAPGNYEITLYIRYGNECTTAVHRHFTTGVEEINSGGGISLYPNPAAEKVVISGFDFGGPPRIEFFDMTGRLVLELHEVTTNTVAISTNSMTEGYYTVRITQSGKTQTLPFIIIH